MKTLIAEDDVPTRMLLTATLRRWGYHVHSVADGTEALSVLEAGEHQILITDWEMPGLDGPGLCERVRRTPLSDYLYILLLTQHSDAASIARGLAAGADDFVSKPFNPVELHTRLEVGKRLVLLWDQLASARRQVALLSDEVAAARKDSTERAMSSRSTDERAVLADIHRRARLRHRSYGLLAIAFSPRMLASDREHWMQQLRSTIRVSDIALTLDTQRVVVIGEGLSETGLQAMGARYAERFAPVASKGEQGVALGTSFYDGTSEEGVDETLARALTLATTGT